MSNSPRNEQSNKEQKCNDAMELKKIKQKCYNMKDRQVKAETWRKGHTGGTFKGCYSEKRKKIKLKY